MLLRKQTEWNNHRFLIKFSERDTGLLGYIAVHSLAELGATGGTRIKKYKNEREQINDAYSLSRAMTYKCLLAGVPFGGAKACIQYDEKSDRKEMLKAYALVLNDLRGIFNTGQDVGTTQKDIILLAKHSPYVNGVESGDLSYYASLGVFVAMTSALRIDNRRRQSFSGKRIAIKGVGKVGSKLAASILAHGGEVVVADIDPIVLDRFVTEHPNARVISPKDIAMTDADVFAPCAFDSDISAKSLKTLGAPIVCGGANNQFDCDATASIAHKKGILCVPDFVANAGGLIAAVAVREHGVFDEKKVIKKIANIQKTTARILKESALQSKPPLEVAYDIAETDSKKTWKKQK